MKNYLLAIIILLFVVLTNNGCQNSDGETLNGNNVDKEENLISVSVEKLSPQDFIESINVLGIVKPFKKANLSYEAGGIIKKIHIEKGRKVKKGDVIIEIENDVLKANMEAAKAQYELAKITYEKQQKIFKDKVNSEIQLIESKYNKDKAEANYKLTSAQYKKTFVKSPINGIVDNRFYETGEFVVPGTQIVTVVSINKMKILVGVPEVYVGQVSVGQDVEVNLKQLNFNTIRGKVIFVGTSVSTSNRTFPTEILIDNPNGLLKPEIVVDVKINKETHSKVFLVPEDVVSRTEKGYMVFVEENGVVESRIVEIVERADNFIALGSGLKEGDNLITVGFQNLIQGQKVNIVK